MASSLERHLNHQEVSEIALSVSSTFELSNFFPWPRHKHGAVDLFLQSIGNPGAGLLNGTSQCKRQASRSTLSLAECAPSLTRARRIRRPRRQPRDVPQHSAY
ncbi:hypothetical protein C8Q76DRAFT_702519 [Earliella scabrosa]|nr:hypothetical protein C8Q76DRAFT_702519 [Earliella scabrosa]